MQARSRAETLPARVEERLQPDARLLEVPVHLQGQLAVLVREVGADPGHADDAAELRAQARAGDAAGRCPVDDDLAALGRNNAVVHLETDELLAEAALAHVLERPLADE